MIPALVAAGALLLAAVLPGPWRGTARAVVLFAIILSPIIALGVFIASWEHRNPATWFLLVPASFCWLSFLDLRCGMSARIARPTGGAVPRLRDAPAPADDDEDEEGVS